MSDKFKMQYHTPSANGGKLFINAMEAVKKMFAENKVHFELTIADWEENEKLKKQLEIAKEALEKINEWWFQPTEDSGCCSSCECNLHPNVMLKHQQLNGDPCPFQIAHDILDKLTAMQIEGEK